MSKKIGRFYISALLSLFLAGAPDALAQQTPDGMTGTISNDSGAFVPGSMVMIVADQTKLTRSVDTNDAGTYSFVNLPIGSYTITVTHPGFQTLNIPSIQLQADRTATDSQYLIPSANPNAVALNTPNPALIEAFAEDAEIPGTAYFLADQSVAALDWNPNCTHSFATKYYYRHDPTIAPYAYSSVAGFTQHLDAGNQVVSLSHTQIVKPHLSITETFGFLREKAHSRAGQPFTPAQFRSACQALTGFDAADCTINTFNSSLFPGTTITWPSTFFLLIESQDESNERMGG